MILAFSCCLVSPAPWFVSAYTCLITAINFARAALLLAGSVPLAPEGPEPPPDELLPDPFAVGDPESLSDGLFTDLPDGGDPGLLATEVLGFFPLLSSLLPPVVGEPGLLAGVSVLLVGLSLPLLESPLSPLGVPLEAPLEATVWSQGVPNCDWQLLEYSGPKPQNLE